MALLYHTELKGPHWIQFLNKEPANMSLVHLFVTAYTYILYIYKYKIYKYI